MPLGDYESKYLEPGEHEVAIIKCELFRPESHTREKAKIFLTFEADDGATHRELYTISEKAAFRLVKIAKAARVPQEHINAYPMPWEPKYDPSVHARFWVRDPALMLRITLRWRVETKMNAYMQQETVESDKFCEIASCRPVDRSAPAPVAKEAAPASESDELPF